MEEADHYMCILYVNTFFFSFFLNAANFWNHTDSLLKSSGTLPAQVTHSASLQLTSYTFHFIFFEDEEDEA